MAHENGTRVGDETSQGRIKIVRVSIDFEFEDGTTQKLAHEIPVDGCRYLTRFGIREWFDPGKLLPHIESNGQCVAELSFWKGPYPGCRKDQVQLREKL